MTGGIGTVLRGCLVIAASPLLPRGWMILTQALAGLALVILGFLRLQEKRQR